MKCPYCGEEMERGIVYLDGKGSTAVIYKPEKDVKKRGLFSKMEPVVWIKYASDEEESYCCKSCKKVMVILPELS